MTNRKKRRRRRPSSGSGPSTTSAPALAQASSAAPAKGAKPGSGASSDRRARKEEARKARDAARKAVRRRELARRFLTLSVISIGIFLALVLLFRASAPKQIPEAALRAAETSGCGDVETPVPDDQTGAGAHAPPFDYAQRPPTSGPHDPSPLPDEPKVYREPFLRTSGASDEATEARAVHNLEHAFVIVYYRANGQDAVGEDVVGRLESLAGAEDLVLMAPYEDLEEGTSLALTAWNKLWECPGTVAAEDAVTIARGFIEAYRGTSNAPEAPGRLT